MVHRLGIRRLARRVSNWSAVTGASIRRQAKSLSLSSETLLTFCWGPVKRLVESHSLVSLSITRLSHDPFPTSGSLPQARRSTVTGAAPVLHRTSLSHRCRAVAQADMPRHPSPQFAMLTPLREQEG